MNRLLVERPEVVHPSVPPADHQHINGQRQAVHDGHGRGDLVGRADALHAHRHHEHARPAPPPLQHLEKIANRRSGWAGDERDPPRKRRQRPLAGRVEPAFGGQFLAQPPQGLFGRPESLRLDLFDDQLVAAASRINVQMSAADDSQSVVQIAASFGRGGSPDDGPNLGFVVLEGQIAVARLGPGEIGNLAADPDRGKAPFDNLLDQQRQCPDAQHRLRRLTLGDGRSGSSCAANISAAGNGDQRVGRDASRACEASVDIAAPAAASRLTGMSRSADGVRGAADPFSPSRLS